MIITGSIDKKRPDGSSATCEWMVDTEAHSLVQMGGDVEIVAEDIDLILALMHTPHEGDENDGHPEAL